MKEMFHSPFQTCGSLTRAALIGAAVFLSVAGTAQRAQADDVDVIVDTLAAAGPIGGVTLGNVEKAVAKGAIRCAMSGQNATIESCLREPLIAVLPEGARQIASCLLKDLGNIEKNAPGCALQALSPTIAKNLPPQLVPCLTTADPKQIAECAVQAGTNEALKQALGQVPPEVKEVAQCIASSTDFKACAAKLTGDLANNKDVKDALEWADKLKNDAGTIQSLIAISEGVRDNDWTKVIAHAGKETTKVLAKALITASLGPLAVAINPLVDSTIDSHFDLFTDLLAAARAKDLAKVGEILAIWKMMEPFRVLCEVAPKEFKDTVCKELDTLAGKTGAAVSLVLSCKALGGNTVPEHVYRDICGAAGDVFSAAVDAATTVAQPVVDLANAYFTTVGTLAEEGAKFVEDVANLGAKAFEEVAKCKVGGVITDICKGAVGIVEKAGDLGEAGFNAGKYWINKAFGPDRMNEADCQRYAQEAVQQAVKNKQDGCNIPNPKFHTNFNEHMKWCWGGGGVRKDSAKAEMNARGLMLLHCDSCKTYQKNADAMVAKATQNGCIAALRKLDGPRWSSGQGHFNWCMSAPGGWKQINGEQANRDSNMRHCDFCNDYRRKTEEQLRQANANGCMGTPPMVGARWNPNAQAHFEWCMTPGSGATEVNREFNERQGNLGHCGFCNGYMNTTNNQIKDAQSRGCYPAMVERQPAWWTPGRGHFTACMAAPAQQSTFVVGERGKMLGSCQPLPTQAIDLTPPPPPAPPPGQPVQQSVTCPNGSQAFSYAQCPHQCWNGQWYPAGYACPARVQTPQPQPQQPQLVRCPNGTMGTSLAQCAHQCWDGRWYSAGYPCPPRPQQQPQQQQPQPVRCPNGSQAFSFAQCPKQCPNGQWIPPQAACPAPVQTTFTCGNGQKVSNAAQCPKRCPNGQWVAANAVCPAAQAIKPPPPPPPPPKCRMVTEQNCPLSVPGSKPPPCKTVQRQVCEGGPSPKLR